MYFHKKITKNNIYNSFERILNEENSNDYDMAANVPNDIISFLHTYIRTLEYYFLWEIQQTFFEVVFRFLFWDLQEILNKINQKTQRMSEDRL